MTSEPARRRRAARAGLSLLEILIVLSVLTILAAAILPRIAATVESVRVRALEASVARLPTQTRDDAERLRMPVRLRVSGTQLVEEQVPLSSDTTGASTQQLRAVDLGSDLTVNSVELNYQSSDSGSWQWTVYPDGSAEPAGVEFTEGQGQLKSMLLTRDATTRWIDGALPDESADQWTAGQLDQENSDATASTTTATTASGTTASGSTATGGG